MAAATLKWLLAAGAVLAWHCAGAHTTYLLHDELLCNDSGQVCLRGWLVHDPHRNEIALDARLQRTASPGTIIISLDGVTPGGQPVTTAVSVEVRGRYSEIIHARFIPQWPYETRWAVRALQFEQAARTDR